MNDHLKSFLMQAGRESVLVDWLHKCPDGYDCTSDGQNLKSTAQFLSPWWVAGIPAASQDLHKTGSQSWECKLENPGWEADILTVRQNAGFAAFKSYFISLDFLFH